MTATTTINSEMPTYFAVCTRSGSWSDSPNSQSAEAAAIREYLSHGDAFNFLSMVLRSAAPPGTHGMSYALLRCNITLLRCEKASSGNHLGGWLAHRLAQARPNAQACVIRARIHMPIATGFNWAGDRCAIKTALHSMKVPIRPSTGAVGARGGEFAGLVSSVDMLTL